MMFRDDDQRARAARAVLVPSHQDHYFTPKGPTRNALAIRRAEGGAMSPGEWILLRVAFVVWSGDGVLPFEQVMYRLSPGNIRAIGQLFLALAAPDHAALDAFILAAEEQIARAARRQDAEDGTS